MEILKKNGNKWLWGKCAVVKDHSFRSTHSFKTKTPLLMIPGRNGLESLCGQFIF